jgi:class 3 adenylate cyclase
VGDTVNLAQRLQEMARPGGQTIVSDATWAQLTERPEATPLPAQLVKGRATPVVTHRIERETWSTA